MPTINILTWHNGSGLQRDAQCLEEILSRAGFTITQTDLCPSRRHPPQFAKFRKFDVVIKRSLQLGANYYYRCLKTLGLLIFFKPRYDINLFLEFIEPRYFLQGKINCFIPNQEWFSYIQQRSLKSCDRILCKTLNAYDIFQRFGLELDYVSFTSQDHYQTQIEMDYGRCLHVAGRSSLKGTQAVIEVWERHPHWPTLTVICRDKSRLNVSPPDAPNIEYISTRVSDEVLTRLQNQCGIRIQPSEVEGFGHVIVEGMSCGAVMVSTDAPPMNEIVQPDRGFLAAYDQSEPKCLGRRYYVDSIQLEQQLAAVFQLDLEERRQLGDRARAWYLENDACFKQKIVSVMQDLLATNSK